MQSRNAEDQHKLSLQKDFLAGSSAKLALYILLAGVKQPTGAESTRDILVWSVPSQCYINKRFDVNTHHLCTHPGCLFYGADGLRAFCAAPCRYFL